MSERYNDRALGIDTICEVRSADLGFNDRDRKGYEPTAYRDFRDMMKWVQIRPGQDVFFDYGAGRGRIVTVAATYPFRKIVGIEISEMLVDACRENVRHAIEHLVCKDIEIIPADASTYPLPDDVTVIHLFNPFEGDLLKRVFGNIHDSLYRSPRTITILYNNPIHFEPILSALDWLEPVVRNRRPSLITPRGDMSDFYSVYRTVG
jgi:hypothetical protein